jgi:PhnB protein
MDFSLHLVFDGQCRAAFEFYADVFRGQIGTMLTYGDSPMASDVPTEHHSRIVHASLTVAGRELAGADVLPDDFEQPQGFYVLLHPKEPVESERVFGRLAEGGEIRIPLQKAFWSPSYGSLVDRFGVPWEISCEGSA